MTTWEYLVFQDPPAERLNALGEKGWELVAVVMAAPYPNASGTMLVPTAYLKRPRIDARSSSVTGMPAVQP